MFQHQLQVAAGKLLAGGILIGLTSGLFVPRAPAQDEARVPRVWIYRNFSEEESAQLSVAERHFTPFLYFPASETSNIGVDRIFPIGDLDPDCQGTCIEFFFAMKGGDDWKGAGFIPGATLGDKLPLNLVEQGLVVGFERPVYLKFSARTVTGERANVRFESCGFSAGSVRDGIRPAHTPSPPVTALTDRWKDITIDLTKKSSGLEKVASPLRVIARSSDNPRADEITVYVDDVRFEVGTSGR